VGGIFTKIRQEGEENLTVTKKTGSIKRRLEERECIIEKKSEKMGGLSPKRKGGGALSRKGENARTKKKTKGPGIKGEMGTRL